MPRKKRDGAPEWARWSDDRLLDLRFCDLGLKLDQTALKARIEQLHTELADRGMKFRPHCWLGEEWFAPDTAPGISIPFYLAHPRLAKLEYKHMYEVEGGTKTTCMQLLRHEAGHAVETAYRLYNRKRWRQLFGDVRRPYPKYYRPKPFSRSYVLHLDWWYAQSHPTEDFAETFAVWLRPRFNWRKRYDGWRALKKLEYVDELMEEIATRKPLLTSRKHVDPVSRLKTTLREHYDAKTERFSTDYPDFYDRDLRKLFCEPRPDRKLQAATSFLRNNTRTIRNVVGRWTGESAYTINMVLKEMASRCREYNLRVDRPAEELRIELAVLVTMQTMNYVHSADHRVPV